MEFLMVDEAMVGQIYDSRDVLDGHASRHAEVILGLGDDEEAPGEMPFDPYLIVESVQLDQPYRGRGLGTYLTCMAIKMIGPGCDIVTVYPFPLNAERDADGTALQPATLTWRSRRWDARRSGLGSSRTASGSTFSIDGTCRSRSHSRSSASAFNARSQPAPTGGCSSACL
jgi:hypothetical protein